MMFAKPKQMLQPRAGPVDENGRPVLLAGKPHQPPAKRQALGNLTNAAPLAVADAKKPLTRASAAAAGAVRASSRMASAHIPAARATAHHAHAAAHVAVHQHAVASVQSVVDMEMEQAASLAEAARPLLPAGVEDIDEFDGEDPQFCSEYVNDIFEYLRTKEVTDRVDPAYMSRQSEITEKMRQILVDWMIEVNLKFKLLTETVFLSVNILDKVLAVRNVPRNRLQLVGIASMLIASKVEEIFAVEVGDFVYIADNAFKREEVLACERDALDATKFCLTSPCPLHFLRRFSKAAKNDSVAHTMGKYIIEMTLLDYNMLKYLPSQIAAGAVYLARRILNKPPYWNATLEHYTKYSEAQAVTYARDLNEMMKRYLRGSLKALYKKYSSPKLLSVARYAPIEIL
eukprot:m51a1_g14731 putative cyclin b (401) ;mRNA; r:231110-232735